MSYNIDEYIADVKKTEIKDYTKAANRLNDIQIARLMHGVMGISTEGAELLDAFKKHIFYGKELDVVNIKEEIGDIVWYLGIICDELNITFEEVMKMNVDKLKARYDDKFSEEAATTRDLDKERKILEDKK